MADMKRRLAIASTVLMLGGCSFVSDALFPTEDTAQPQQGQPQAASSTQGGGASEGRTTSASQSAPSAEPMASASGGGSMSSSSSSSSSSAQGVQLGTTEFEPPAVGAGTDTGTFVGQKVQTYRGELKTLQDNIRQRNATLQDLRAATRDSARAYHENVAVINTRLQAGTTPGNPELKQRWQTAQAELSKIPDNVTSMNQLATEVASDSAMAAYLLDSIRNAYTLTGAVEADHEQLRGLEDITNQTVVLIDRLLNELNSDITRQQAYVNNEMTNLNTLAVAVGEDSGTLEEVYEPFLIQNGFLMRTPRGRVATNKAYKRFGFALPADRREGGSSQATLVPAE